MTTKLFHHSEEMNKSRKSFLGVVARVWTLGIALQHWGWLLQITKFRLPVFLGVSQIPVQSRLDGIQEEERKKQQSRERIGLLS